MRGGSASTFQSNLQKNESLTSKIKITVSFDGWGAWGGVVVKALRY
jgi:hypothetical protein